MELDGWQHRTWAAKATRHRLVVDVTGIWLIAICDTWGPGRVHSRWGPSLSTTPSPPGTSTPSPNRSAEQMSSSMNSKPSEQPLPDPHPAPGEAKVDFLCRSIAFLFLGFVTCHCWLCRHFDTRYLTDQQLTRERLHLTVVRLTAHLGRSFEKTYQCHWATHIVKQWNDIVQRVSAHDESALDIAHISAVPRTRGILTYPRGRLRHNSGRTQTSHLAAVSHRPQVN